MTRKTGLVPKVLTLWVLLLKDVGSKVGMGRNKTVIFPHMRFVTDRRDGEVLSLVC